MQDGKNSKFLKKIIISNLFIINQLIKSNQLFFFLKKSLLLCHYDSFYEKFVYPFILLSLLIYIILSFFRSLLSMVVLFLKCFALKVWFRRK